MKKSKVKQYFVDVAPETVIADYNSVCNKVDTLTHLAASNGMSSEVRMQVKRLIERKHGLEGYLEHENIEYIKR